MSILTQQNVKQYTSEEKRLKWHIFPCSNLMPGAVGLIMGLWHHLVGKRQHRIRFAFFQLSADYHSVPNLFFFFLLYWISYSAGKIKTLKIIFQHFLHTQSWFQLFFLSIKRQNKSEVNIQNSHTSVSSSSSSTDVIVFTSNILFKQWIYQSNISYLCHYFKKYLHILKLWFF